MVFRYPISEDVSVGLLLLGGNYVGIALTISVQVPSSIEK
jgi:hypothetical protein